MNRDRPHPFAHFLLVALALAFAVPLVWMILTSLKPLDQIENDPHEIVPTEWRIENYRDVLETMPFFRYLRNTLLLCAGTVLGTVLSCSMVAYGFARLKWPGRNLAFALLVATMLMPWQATMIPRFLLLRELGLYNTLWALVLPTFLGEAFYIFLLRQFFLTIPEDLADAARLDGCSEWGVFWRIMLPLSRPALATVALLQFIASWNDYGGPLLYLNDPEKFPLSYGLEQLVSAYSSQTHLLMAGSVLMTAPIIVLFFLTQRTFIEGVATSGIKG